MQDALASVSYPVDILAPWPLPFACTRYSTSTMYSTMYSAMYPLIPTIPGIFDKAFQAPPSPQVQVQVLRHGSSHASAIASSSLRRPSGSPSASSSIPIQDTGQVAVRCAYCSVCCLGFHLCTLTYHHLGTSSPWLVAWASRDAPVQASTRASRAKVRQMLRPGPGSLLVLIPLLFFLSHARAPYPWL